LNLEYRQISLELDFFFSGSEKVAVALALFFIALHHHNCTSQLLLPFFALIKIFDSPFTFYRNIVSPPTLLHSAEHSSGKDGFQMQGTDKGVRHFEHVEYLRSVSVLFYRRR